MKFIFGMQINTKVSYKSIISLAYLGMLFAISQRKREG